MKFKAFFITILFSAFCLNSTSYAQTTSKEVDALVEKALAKFNVPGAAIAIVKDGAIIHSKGYGVKSIITKEKVDEHTQFAIASNSKAFTTAALAILVEEGKISWQDKVIEHIPEFKMYNAYVTENFNIQDLLTHRSGLGLGVGDLMTYPAGADFTINDVISSFQHFKPQSAFRTQYDYDNLLYLVAGELIARKSGMTWDKFIKTRIMNPLAMDNSFPSLDAIQNKSNLASPHSIVNGKLSVIPDNKKSINGAAGGIYANVDDLANWMLVHLNRGKFGQDLKNQLFTEKSQNEIWKIHMTTDVNRNPRYNSHFAGYGLGWNLTDVKGNMKVYHNGGLPGMISYTVLIPDMKLGIVILTNSLPGGSAFTSSVANTVLDSYLELDDFQWIENIAARLSARVATGDEVTKKVWETVAKADSKHIMPEDYVGIYKDAWFGKAEVFKKDGKLWFKSYRSPKLNGPMAFYKANSFAIKWEYQDENADALAMFNLDENGKAQGIKMRGISPNLDFSYDFKDLDFKRVTSASNKK